MLAGIFTKVFRIYSQGSFLSTKTLILLFIRCGETDNCQMALLHVQRKLTRLTIQISIAEV